MSTIETVFAVTFFSAPLWVALVWSLRGPGWGRARRVIGDLGFWGLLALGIAIHVGTVIVAYQWFGGALGLLAALCAAVIPVVPEVLWGVLTAVRAGTVLHWYVAAVVLYPALWLIWIAGGVWAARRRGNS